MFVCLHTVTMVREEEAIREWAASIGYGEDRKEKREGQNIVTYFNK